MKSILLTALLSIFLVLGNTQKSYSQESNMQNYVVLTKNVQQLKPILLAAKELSNEDGKQFGNFEIIVCGKGIHELTNSEVINAHLKEARKLGATIVACGFSLKKFNVDTNKLQKDIKIVDNGILYNFQLQKKGYKSLSL